MGKLERLNPRATRTAQPLAIDARGRVLQAGDEVLILNAQQTFFIREIVPNLDPKLPPNLVRIGLATSITLGVRSGFPDGQIVRVASRQEIEAAIAKQQGKEPEGGTDAEALAREAEEDQVPAPDEQDGPDTEGEVRTPKETEILP